MREVDGLALAGDWLLVKAGYIGNLDLETAVTEFTARRKKDPSLLMDCVVTSRARRCVYLPNLSEIVALADLTLFIKQYASSSTGENIYAHNDHREAASTLFTSTSISSS